MADGAADSNGRVTLAILATKLDYVIAELREFTAWCGKSELAAKARDDRISRVEETVRIIKWASAILIAVLVPISIALIKQALGL